MAVEEAAAKAREAAEVEEARRARALELAKCNCGCDASPPSQGWFGAWSSDPCEVIQGQVSGRCRGFRCGLVGCWPTDKSVEGMLSYDAHAAREKLYYAIQKVDGDDAAEEFRKDQIARGERIQKQPCPPTECRSGQCVCIIAEDAMQGGNGYLRGTDGGVCR